MQPTTLEVITRANRAYGSIAETSVLEAVYTTLINTFSAFTMPRSVELFPAQGTDHHGMFPVIGHISVGDIEFEVLSSLGGHLAGQIYLLSTSHGLLFSSDTVINFESLSSERREYSTLAVNLVNSVNVASDIAQRERKALLEIAKEIDTTLAPLGKRCLICGGHGAVSTLDQGRLVIFGITTQYTHWNRHVPPSCDTTNT